MIAADLTLLRRLSRRWFANVIPRGWRPVVSRRAAVLLAAAVSASAVCGMACASQGPVGGRQTASPSPTAESTASPIMSASPAMSRSPIPGTLGSQMSKLALSAVLMGVRRCSPACPAKASDASPWYSGNVSIYCGGPNAETVHLFEGYVFSWTGGPPISVTVQWSGTFKYTTGKDYPTSSDTHVSQTIADKSGSTTGLHTFEMSQEYLLAPPAGLSYASASFVLSWTNSDGTTGHQYAPGLFQFHCIQPTASP